MMSEDLKSAVAETTTPNGEIIESISENPVENAAAAETVAEEVKPEAEAPVAGPATTAEDAAGSEVPAPSEDTEKPAEDASQEAPAGEDGEKVAEEETDYSGKSLKELVDIFQSLLEEDDMHKLHKHAELIKANFHKTLHREKVASGLFTPAASGENPESEGEETVSVNPFAEIERGFKELYAGYRSRRAAFLAEQEKQKEQNYQEKLSLLERLKALAERQDDLKDILPAFREIQNKWRQIGPVVQSKARDLADSYQHQVEMFYDYVKINNEFRDLDFKKNLEAKIVLCEKAEALAEEEDAVSAFKTLQALHEEWKTLGPVSKEYRVEIWDRFRAASSVINKRHQAHYAAMKDTFLENLEAKKKICEEIEQIVAAEIEDAASWARHSARIEELQQEWKKIGFATKKENQKIYERFRAACNTFFDRKKQFFSGLKGEMQQNYAIKKGICEQAEALSGSTDWKGTAEALVNLQQQWKEVGALPRGRNEKLWKRFRAACDTFFENKAKAAGTADGEFAENLARKQQLIEEVGKFEPTEDRDADFSLLKEFQRRWDQIGFVPIKDKKKITAAFKTALDGCYDAMRSAVGEGRARISRKVLSQRDKLMQEFLKKEQEIATWQNNVGFFAKTKNAEAILEDINRKIEAAKEELAALEQKIRDYDNQNEAQDGRE